MNEPACLLLLLLGAHCFLYGDSQPIPLPEFALMRQHYPGYAHHGGRYHNHHVISMIGMSVEESGLLLHDTSALRLSYALNRIGGRHSLGHQLIRLSKFGHDSVGGKDGLEYIYHPIAYGPYLADKYGYPSVSKLHQQDPISTKKNFWGRQGILQVITYTKKNNLPKGHVALWDCNHFHQSKDWIAGHTLITVEFWESPDSNCTGMDTDPAYQWDSPASPARTYHSNSQSSSQSVLLPVLLEASRPHPHLRHKHWERRFLARHHLKQS